MFNKIDLENWERKELYNHFFNIAKCTYSITANVDITRLLPCLKMNNLRLYPAIIYFLSKLVNQNYLLRLDKNERGELGYHDISHPSYTIANAQKNGFSGIWTTYDENFFKFYTAYLNDVEQYSQSTTYAPKANQPQNTFYVSCVPWLSFTALTVTVHNMESFQPRFTIGKHFTSDGKIQLPIATELHHAACDGYGACKIYTDLQELCDSFTK